MGQKFWKWNQHRIRNETDGSVETHRVLELNGVISESTWMDDDVTPEMFKADLMAGDGDITVWINSPGGDCVAAAQIYNMLIDYPHNVTVKIDGIAASAASVIAMAGTTVQMSPVSMLMIHNPMVMAFGDTTDMKKAAEMLDAVKDSIINAYELKTGLSRAKISHMMDAETWMDAGRAMELGFCDGILQRMEVTPLPAGGSMEYSQAAVTNSLMEKIAAKCRIEAKPDVNAEPEHAPETVTGPSGRRIADAMERLTLLRHS